MENENLLAFLPLNWTNFFIEHILPQVHRVSNCAYPFGERATVSYRRRYIELSDWLCGQAKSMHSRTYK